MNLEISSKSDRNFFLLHHIRSKISKIDKVNNEHWNIMHLKKVFISIELKEKKY